MLTACKLRVQPAQISTHCIQSCQALKPLVAELLPKKKKSSGDGKIISHSKVREARKIFYQYAGADAKLGVQTLLY